VTKIGTGTQTFSAANTYTGTTTISAGTLQIGNAGATGALSTSSAIVDNANLTFSRTNAVTQGTDFANGISGTGSITQVGGLLTLSGVNTFSGGLTVSSGTLNLGSATALGSGTLTIGTTLTTSTDLTGANKITNNLSVTGNLIVAGSSAVELAGGLNEGGSRRVLTNNTGTNLILSGVISGDGGNGLGLITTSDIYLTGTSAFTGNVDFRGTGGALVVSNIGASGASGNLGAGSLIKIGLTTTSGTLRYTGTGESTNRTIDLGGTTGGVGLDQSGSGTLKFTNNFTASGSGAKTLTLLGSTAGTGEIAGTIVDSGSTTNVTKTGTGMWTLSGNNTFSGAVTMTSGTLALTGSNSYVGGTTLSGGAGSNSTLIVGNKNALGTGQLSFGTSTGTYTLIASTALTGANALANNFSITAGGAMIISGTNDLEFTGTTLGSTNSANRTLTINNTGSTTLSGPVFISTSGTSGVGLILNGTGNISIGGAIANSTAGGTLSFLTYAGSGKLTLSGTNTFTGGLTVSSGTLAVATVNDASTNGVFGNSATAVLLGSSGTTAVLEYTGATASSTRALSLVSGGTAAFQVDNAAANLTLSGTIGSAGALLKSGSGTLTLSGSNSYTGGTTINAGVLQAGGTSAFGANSAFTLANVSGAALNLNGFDLAIGSLTGGGATGGNVSLGANNLTIGGDNTSPAAYAGAISGSGNLTKVGTGTLNLSGTNTYTGNTTINAGMVVVSNTASLGASSGTTIFGGNSTMQLGASFDTSRNTVLNSGVTGTLDTNGFAQANNGVFSGSGSLIKIGTGTLTLGGVNTFTGSLSVKAGTLAIGTINNISSNGVLGNSASQVVLGSSGTAATLEYTGADASTSRTFSMATSGTGIFQIDNASTTLTLNTNGGSLNSINGSGVFVKSGAGTLAFTGTNNGINGPSTFIINQGVVNAAHSGVANSTNQAIRSTNTIINNGGTLLFGAGGNGDQIISTGTVTVNNGGTWDLNNFNESIAGIADTDGIGGVITNNAVTSGTSTFTLSNTGTLTFDGQIKDGTGLGKVGVTLASSTGMTMILNGSNSYSGQTSVNNNNIILKIGNAHALGTSSGGNLGASAAAVGDVLDLNGFALVGGDFNGGLFGTISNSSSTAASWDGAFVLKANSAVDGTGDINLSGFINGSSGIALTKNGSNTLTLSGTATNSTLSLVANGGTVILAKTGTQAIRGGGGVIVNNGATLQLGGSGSNQILDANTSQGGSAGGVVINNGTFDINSRYEAINSLQIGDGTNNGNVIGTTGTLVVLTTGSTSLAYIDARSGSSSAILAGTVGLTKTTAGTLVLTGSSIYTGDTTLNAGTIIANNAASLGNASGDLIFSGNSTLQLGASFNTTRDTVLNTGVTGTINTNGFNQTNSGVFSGSGALAKTGSGTLTVSGTSTFTGGTTITAGSLQVGNGGTTGALAASGTIVNNGNLTFNRSNTVTQGTDFGAISGSGSLTQAGSGALVLSSSNAFTGATTVASGTVKANAANALGSTSSITVQSAGLLQISASNSINDTASVTLSGGTILRDSGVSETFGNLSLTANSTIDYGSGAVGSLTFGTYSPAQLLTVSNFAIGNSLVFGSDLSSIFGSDYSSYFDFGGHDIASSWSGSEFTITSVPEPSTIVAGGLMLGLLLWPQRKRFFTR